VFAHALDILGRLKAVEHTWEDSAIIVRASKPDAEVRTLLDALGIRFQNPILSISRPAAA